MFATFHSMFNSLKSGLLHLTGQTNSRKGRAKVNDGIISGTIFPGTISVDQYNGIFRGQITYMPNGGALPKEV
jgi:hypothetical protein